MITKLHIENFQSHRDTTFEFDKGINVLIGRSDSGKSAVWRALYWLAFNSPSGEAFRSHWGGDTIVEVWLEDGTHVQRIKTKKENMYVLNGMELKAIRTEVPKEVKQALGFEASNFQGQLDASFLLMSSSGEVARVLNEYLDIQSIDTAVSSINSAARKNNSALNSLLDQESRQEEALQLPRYQKAEGFRARLEELQDREEILAGKKKAHTSLSKLLERYRGVKTSLTPLKRADKLLDRAVHLATRAKELRKLEAERDSLAQSISRARDLQKKVRRTNDRLIELEELKAEYLEDSCPVCGSEL